MVKEFTATVYIIEDDRILLIYHKKLNKWLPPGGHLEENETPPQAAKREALEETGIEVELIPQENIWVDNWNATSFERPYMCLLEKIPQYKDVPEHHHMDFIYIARPIGGSIKAAEAEVDAVRWFSLEELEQLTPDQEIYRETLDSIQHILPKTAGGVL